LAKAEELETAFNGSLLCGCGFANDQRPRTNDSHTTKDRLKIDAPEQLTLESNQELPLRVSGSLMPLYEYKCKKCGHRFEKIRKFSDAPLKKCPECGGAVEQLLSAPAVQFKGSGWYVTDYAKKGGAGSASSDGSSDKAEKTEKSEKKDEAKPKTEHKKPAKH
jgi:putative FmdB family regulatory protein